VADRHPRIILSSEGLEGSGKTRFALTAPRGEGGLWWQDFDWGLEGVEGADRVDEHRTYDLLAAQWMPEAEAKRYAKDVMKRFVADFREALAKKARTLVADTFTAAWAGQRLARGGEGGDSYVEYEEEFRSLIRAAYASPHTNVILIHHLARDWKRNKDGKAYKGETWSRDGMDGIANMRQLAIRQKYTAPIVSGGQVAVPGFFSIDVLKCRDNIGLVGTTLPGMDFAMLGAMVAPAIDWSK
jgi:hypothetical protein